MKEVIKELGDLGYTGSDNLSEIIDWIRTTKNFNIWVEHGTLNKKGNSHDVSTDIGCHRGSYLHYELAQFAGIEIFLKK